MELEIIAYNDLFGPEQSQIIDKIKSALFNTGIVGLRGIPGYVEKAEHFIKTAQAFSNLDESIKQRYAPVRDAGDTEGYELGAEWFKDSRGEWQVDDKKASFYAFVPDKPQNKWPKEIDLKSAYLDLGELIFKTGKTLLNIIGINKDIGIDLDKMTGYGRMLHYHKDQETYASNPDWCGAHFDHSVFTGLMPAYYFKDGVEVDEPEEAGLYIIPRNGTSFEKVYANDKSVLLFQVGEFAQLATHDKILATQHIVKKAKGNIDRYTLAIFHSPDDHTQINSKSELAKDSRYLSNMKDDGSILYKEWETASFERYRATP